MDKPKNRIPNSELMNDFRSPLLVIAALFLSAAVIFTVPGIIALFDRELADHILALLALKFVDPAICKSWLNIWRLVQVLTLILPFPMMIGLWLCVADMRNKDISQPMPPRSIRYFVRAVRIARVVFWTAAVLLAAVFVIRLVRYIVLNAPTLGGILFILVTLLLEGLFAIAVAVVMVIVIRCMNAAVHTAETIHAGKSAYSVDVEGEKECPVIL